MDGPKRVAHNLKRLRLARGISQESLAVDSGVSATYVSQIETLTYNPTVAILDRLAATMGVDISELFAPLDPSASDPPALRSGPKAQ